MSLDAPVRVEHTTQVSDSQPAGHDLWRSHDSFTEVTYQICCIPDIYITVHNSSKISYEVAMKIICNWGVITVLKGHSVRKVEGRATSLSDSLNNLLSLLI